MKNYTEITLFPEPSKFDFGRNFPKICEISHDFHCENLRKKRKSAEKAVLCAL